VARVALGHRRFPLDDLPPHAAALQEVHDRFAFGLVLRETASFGQWDNVLLDDVDRRAVYVPDGLGHAYLSLADNSAVVYMCSTPYAPGKEHGVHPLDPEIGIDWPTTDRAGAPLTQAMSAKDRAAPRLAEVLARNLLPA
jgi:dTDP-4-dehydrorhamnose 3,5-epimerase